MTSESVNILETDKDQYFVTLADYSTITGYEAAATKAVELSSRTGNVATIYKAVTRMKIEGKPNVNVSE